MAGLPFRVAATLCGLLPLVGVQAFGWGGGWSGPSAKKHAVEELTDSNFAQFLKDNPVTAVMFYAPWCFYSQQMMPAWDTAAQKLLLHDPPVHVAKINSNKYMQIGEEYGISAFPTLKLFVEGSVFEYPPSTPRSWQQIVKWVNHHLDRDHVLKDAKDLDHYLHDNDLNVVGIFHDGQNSSAFGHVTRHFDDVMFAESKGDATSKEIADFVAKHASLTCETVDVGISELNAKSVPLQRAGMTCGDSPKNPQRPDWTDKFTTAIEGEKLMVRRTDSSGGWSQHLQLRCCDADKGQAMKFKVNVPSIVMFMPHDERFAIYDGDIEDMHALDTWVAARRTPMVMQLSPDTAERILEGGGGPTKLPVLFFLSREPQEHMEKEIREAAKELRGRAIICFSGLSQPIERRLAELAGVEEDSPPVLTLIDMNAAGGHVHNARKYRLPTENLKASAVVNFVEGFGRGSLKPWLKSEPEPSPDEMGSVGVLVGSTFSATAFDATKDVLVDFYAPWCGHCRKFEPNYKALAKKLRHVNSLRIMKIDATRNEIEDMQITGFPTVILFPAGDKPKKTVYYQGNRQPEDMVSWLHEHCSTHFDDTPPKEAKHDPVESGLLDPSEDDL